MYIFAHPAPTHFIDPVGLKPKKCCPEFFDVTVFHGKQNGLTAGLTTGGKFAIQGHHLIQFEATDDDADDCDCDCKCCLPCQEVRGWFREKYQSTPVYKIYSSCQGKMLKTKMWKHEWIHKCDTLKDKPCEFKYEDWPGPDDLLPKQFYEARIQLKMYVWDTCAHPPDAVTSTHFTEFYVRFNWYGNSGVWWDKSYYKKLGIDITPPNLWPPPQ